MEKKYPELNNDELNLDFPKSDIEEINDEEDEWLKIELARQEEEKLNSLEGPADLDDPNRFRKMKEALEENEDEVECVCCYDLFPKADCIKTKDGYVCKACDQANHSHDGTNLDLIDANPFDLNYDDPRRTEIKEPEEIKGEPVDANEIRKHEEGIEENLEEHWWDDDDPMNWSDKEPLLYKIFYHGQPMGYVQFDYRGHEQYPSNEEIIKLAKRLGSFEDFPLDIPVIDADIVWEADDGRDFDLSLETIEESLNTNLNESLSLKEDTNFTTNFTTDVGTTDTSSSNFNISVPTTPVQVNTQEIETALQTNFSDFKFDTPEIKDNDSKYTWRDQVDNTPKIDMDNVVDELAATLGADAGDITDYGLLDNNEVNNEVSTYTDTSNVNVSVPDNYTIDTSDISLDNLVSWTESLSHETTLQEGIDKTAKILNDHFKTGYDLYQREKFGNFEPIQNGHQTDIKQALEKAKQWSTQSNIDLVKIVAKDAKGEHEIIWYNNGKPVKDHNNFKRIAHDIIVRNTVNMGNDNTIATPATPKDKPMNLNKKIRRALAGINIDTKNISSEKITALRKALYGESLEESQSQEIGDFYRKFSKDQGIDLDELVYGDDGFMKSCYPEGFPDFNGDVIYSQKYWEEFEKWLRDTKGIELKEHINDRPADIENDQENHGVDNAVVDCKKYTLVAHSEDEKPVDCKLEKPALEEPVAGEQVDVKLYEEAAPVSGLDQVKIEVERDGESPITVGGSGYVADLIIIRKVDNKYTAVGHTSTESGYEDDYEIFSGADEGYFDTLEDLLRYLLDEGYFDNKDNSNYADFSRADIEQYLNSKNESLNEAKKDEEELPPDPGAVKVEVHGMLNNLVADEIEAIDGYEEVKADLQEQPIEHKDEIIATIDHIKDEEKEHIDELIDAAAEIPFDKEESNREVEGEKEEEKFSEPENPFESEFESFNAYGEKVNENCAADTPFDSEAKVGDKIRIIHLEGEDDRYDGREGVVDHIDGLGQLHGTWGGLAIIPGVDNYVVITDEGYKGTPEERTTHLEYTDNDPTDGEAVLPDNIAKQLTENDLTEASSAETRAYKNGGQDAQDYIQGKAIARIKDPAARDAAVAAAKAGRPDAVKDFTGDRKEDQAIDAFDKKMQSMANAGTKESLEEDADVDYVEYMHSYCNALEPHMDELRKIDDLEELKQAILNIVNGDEDVNTTHKKNKFTWLIQNKKWASPANLMKYLEMAMAKAKSIEVKVDDQGELIKEDLDEDDTFTPQEQEEYNCDEFGYSNDSYDQWAHCAWCEQVWGKDELRTEVDFGRLCPDCINELKSRGETLTFRESLEEAKEPEVEEDGGIWWDN